MSRIIYLILWDLRLYKRKETLTKAEKITRYCKEEGKYSFQKSNERIGINKRTKQKSVPSVCVNSSFSNYSCSIHFVQDFIWMPCFISVNRGKGTGLDRACLNPYIHIGFLFGSNASDPLLIIIKAWMWKNRRHSILTAGNCVSMHDFFVCLKDEAVFQISLDEISIYREGWWPLITVKSLFSLIWQKTQCLQQKKILHPLTSSNKYLFRESCNYALHRGFFCT